MSNTKKEMLEAYNALLKEVEAKSLENPKEEQKRHESAAVVKKAEALSAEEVDGFARKVMEGFEKSIQLVQKQLKEGFEKLHLLNETIKIKEEWIEDLYAIQSNADSLSTLILAQKRQKEEGEQKLQESKQELELELEETRAKWKREQEQYNEALKQEKADVALQRKREEEEYQYSTNKRRRTEEEEFQERLQSDEQELSERTKAFEQERNEREKALLAAEGELARLRELEQGLDEMVADAVSEAVEKTEERLNREHRFEFDLAQKETEGLLKLKDQQVDLLEKKIVEMESQLKEAGLKVATSEKTVKDIAFRAIESSTLTARTLTRESRPAPARDSGDEE